MIKVGYMCKERLGEALFLLVANAGGVGAGRSFLVLTLRESESSVEDFKMHAGSATKRSWQWLISFTEPA